MPQSPSTPEPLPSPNSPMTPAERSAYNRLVARIREARRAQESIAIMARRAEEKAAANAAAKAAAVEEARAEYERVRAGQDRAA